MADPPYYMDPGSSDGSTEVDKWEYVKGSIDQLHGLVPQLLDAPSKLDKAKDVKDSIKSPPSHFGITQKKFINMLTTRTITGINTEFQRKLDLSGCGLTMLPEGIRDLPNLKELNLSNNPLNHSFPSWFCHLKLRKLDLSGCGLTMLPEGIEDLRNLEELNLSNNPINHSFPFWFCHYKLRKLDLSGCGFTMLPEGIWDLHSNLEELNLSNNPLNHSFPSRFRHYKLRKLDLSGCGLTMLPEGIEDLRNLEELNLSNNPLNHSFPSWFHHYKLRKLDLSGCGFTMLPEGIEDLRNLEELNLSNNPLNHSFPFWFCHYKLRKLDLSGCGLATFPEGIRTLDNLEELNLSNNPLNHSFPSWFCHLKLRKLDLSGCGLKEWPEGLKPDHFHRSLELNLSNNLFDHRNLLEKLNRKEFHSIKWVDSRIIFEDAIYTHSGTVWEMEVREDAAVSTETWLDEFCRIRKSEKLTIETYHSMLKSLKILVTLLGDNEEFFLKQELTWNRCFSEILHYLNNIVSEKDHHWHKGHNARNATYYLKKAVEGLTNGTTTLDEAMSKCAIAFKEAREASSDTLSVNNGLLVAELKMISQIMSSLTKPEAAILDCLQSLQELHNLHAVRVMFSYLENEDAAKSVLKMNKILFKFVQEFFRPPPTVEEWPATIKLLNERIYNPLFDIDAQFLDEGLMHAEKAVLRKTKLDIGEVGNIVQDPVTNVAEYSFTISESCEQTPDNSITVDQKGGCFSLPEVCAFLLFPPNAVDEKVTLKCSRRKHKECQERLRNGEAFVSRILKIEPEGVTFKKTVTVLLSHSLDEDQDFLSFYELIVEIFSRTGCQELKTEPISSIEDVPKEICNKEILNDYLPLAKATIQETCTLAAATRARFSQILIPTNRRYVFSKQYGDVAELKITFPAGVTKKIRSLNVQLFPADAVVNKEISLNKSLVCAPVIRVSEGAISFLKGVDVELTYSHSDIASIEEEFLPVGKKTKFTTDYGLLLHGNWQALNSSDDIFIERSGKNQLKFSFSIRHFLHVQAVVKTRTGVPPTKTGIVDMKNPACHHAIALAVHDTSSSPKTVRTVLAPKHMESYLYKKWGTRGVRFTSRLKYEELIYVSVDPMSDAKYITLRFDPDDMTELPGIASDSVDLTGKCVRFARDIKSEGDCAVPIHICETRSVQPSEKSHLFVVDGSGQISDNSITIDQNGAWFSLPEIGAILLFPPNAVDKEVTLKCSRVKHKDCQVKPNGGEVFVSQILKIEPEGVTFEKPVTVLLCHSLYEDQDFLSFYDLIVENLSPTGCQELKTERISCIKDVPKEISNKEILNDYLPLAKATIQETCTLAAATRVSFSQILIPADKPYVFSKQYGDVAKLKIKFPAGVTEETLSLKVQLFPADAVVNNEIRLNKSLVCAPVIRVSGQTTPFLKAVDVELTYSHSDVANIEEEFLPVGKTIKFTTEYGLLLHNHNETKSKSNWQALNENNDVSIERSRKDLVRFLFSVKHFSDVHTVMTTRPDSYVPPPNADTLDMNNLRIHRAIVLAVHDTGSSPSVLHAVMGPKHYERLLHKEWKVKGCDFMDPLSTNDTVYFCVPIAEKEHLYLEDCAMKLNLDGVSIVPNNVAGDADLQGKYMRFLNKECNEGENHTTQTDCRAKVQIHFSEGRSVQASAERSESPQERNVSSDQEGAHDINEGVKRRCELFEENVETAARTKLEISKDPKGGKATKFMETAGPTATIAFSLAAGIIVAVSVPTYGAASFAAALVAGATVLVKRVDKHLKQVNAKVVNGVVATEREREKMSGHINCTVKEAAKELSRIFEYQLVRLRDNEQVKILAECAVDLMLDFKENDKFDRNTLLKNVLQDGDIKKIKKTKLTTMEGVTWLAPSVFREPGLRRQILEKDRGEFEYLVKPENACNTFVYGYRGQFLEMKKYGCKNGEYETAVVDETPPVDETSPMEETHRDPGVDSCEECSRDCENWPTETESKYFVDSDIDSQYTESVTEHSTYNPVHILIRCPKIWDVFQRLKEPSLARFLRAKMSLPPHHLVYPVYRAHSPGKVSDLNNSDLSGSDFSRSNFTNCSLERCNFNKCIMLFTNLAGSTVSDSTFCDTYISNSNLKKVKTFRCKWMKTSLLHSLTCGSDLDIIGGNCLDGTDVSKMNGSNVLCKREWNCDENQTRANIPRPNFSDIRGSQYEENRLPPNRKCRNPDEPSTSRETAFYQNVADDMEEMHLNETTV